MHLPPVFFLLRLCLIATSILVAESYGGNLVSFSEDGSSSTRSRVERVNGETWEPLEKLAKGEVSVGGDEILI